MYSSISGPILLIRLENKKGHTIVLMGDQHNPLSEQVECPISSNSIRVDEYLKKQFRTNKKIGFYLEMSKGQLPAYNNPYQKTRSHAYIHKLRTLVADNINYNKSKKVIPSKTFPNVMFHYFDIRLDIPEFDFFLATPIISVHNIKYELSLLSKMSKEFLFYLQKSKDFQKITKIEHKSLKTSITDLQKEIISEYTKKINMKKALMKSDVLIKKFNKQKFVVQDRYLDKIQEKFKRMYHFKYLDMITLIVMMNDLYLFRRLLDKNYDTKIDYIFSGCWHTINITLFLLKYTDYKITFCSGNKTFIEKHFKDYSPKWMLKNIEIATSNTLGYTEHEPSNQCVNLAPDN